MFRHALPQPKAYCNVLSQSMDAKDAAPNAHRKPEMANQAADRRILGGTLFRNVALATYTHELQIS